MEGTLVSVVASCMGSSNHLSTASDVGSSMDWMVVERKDMDISNAPGPKDMVAEVVVSSKVPHFQVVGHNEVDINFRLPRSACVIPWV